MADPVTWMAIGTLASIGFGFYQAGEQKHAKEKQDLAYKEQLKAQEEQYKSDIATLETNIDITKSNIEQKKNDMAYDIGVLGESQKKFNVQQRATMGAAGAVIRSGTPMQVMLETLKSQQEEMGHLKTSYESDIKEFELELGGYKKQLQQKKTLLTELQNG